MKKNTRLAYLLNKLNVRQNELAQQTGIDKTLISRFKNGTRTISHGSGYAKKIASYFLSINGARQQIEKILYAYGLDGSKGTVHENLALWLQEKTYPKLSAEAAATGNEAGGYDSNFSVFLGGQGLRSALIAMLDHAVNMPGPQNIILVIKGSSDWIIEDPGFVGVFIDRLAKAREKGVTLTAILRDNIVTDQVSMLAGAWLAAHLGGCIRSYYYDDNVAKTDTQIIAAVKGEICFRMYHDPDVADGIYIAMYSDRVTVRQTYNMCLSYRELAQPQFKYGFFQDPENFLEEISEDALLDSEIYAYQHVPSFESVTEGRLHEFAQVSKRECEEKISNLKPLFKTPAGLKKRALSRHAYCIESIEELLLPGRHKSHMFSVVFEKNIYHSKTRLKEQLENIKEWLVNIRNFEVLFLPRRIFDKILPINLISAKNQFSVAWPAHAEESTCVKEKMKTAAIFEYAQSVWDGIPKYYKNRQKAIRQVDSWLVLLD